MTAQNQHRAIEEMILAVWAILAVLIDWLMARRGTQLYNHRRRDAGYDPSWLMHLTATASAVDQRHGAGNIR